MQPLQSMSPDIFFQRLCDKLIWHTHADFCQSSTPPFESWIVLHVGMNLFPKSHTLKQWIVLHTHSQMHSGGSTHNVFSIYSATWEEKVILSRQKTQLVDSSFFGWKCDPNCQNWENNMGHIEYRPMIKIMRMLIITFTTAQESLRISSFPDVLTVNSYEEQWCIDVQA